MTNFERWRFYCDSFESPDIFIDWTYWATIGASLQRRVALFGKPDVDHPSEQIYPNPFVVLIGPPGVGKTVAAREAIRIFREFIVTKERKDGEIEQHEVIKTGPSSITVQALYRYLATNATATQLDKVIPNPRPKGNVYIHSSLAFFCGNELGNLIETNSDGLVSFLTEAWDCDAFHRETKTQGSDVIPKLCMTLLGAATQTWVQEVTASKLLKQGFAARTIFLYADKKRKLTHKFTFNAEQMAARKHLVEHVRNLTTVFGEAKFTPEADAFVRSWYESGGCSPLNRDKRLLDYYERKKIHLYKLAMAVHFSESLTLEISLDEVKQALAILTTAETSMHKALSFGGENPIYNIAQEALRAIEATNGEGVGLKKLLLELFDMGDKEQIELAVAYLVDTDQIKSRGTTKGPVYERKTK